MKKQQLFILVIAGLLATAGCRQKTQVVPSEGSDTPQTSSIINGPVTDTINWHRDDLGNIHNGGLDTLKSLPSFPAVPMAQARPVVQTYISSKGLGPNYAFDGQVYNEVLTNIPSVAQLNAEVYIDQAYNNGRINSNQRQSLLQLNNILKGNNIDNILVNLVSFESSILSTNTLTQNEKLPITGTIAVAKASIAYWKNVVNNSNNPWHTTPGGTISLMSAVSSSYWDAWGWWMGFTKLTDAQLDNIAAAYNVQLNFFTRLFVRYKAGEILATVMSALAEAGITM
ncbi:hypothetical protein SAMN04488128_103748 [Chitinophaga eiseniae]|uniref:Uncharacterized protein n=1 Tax=Chitinophaga eiseniae TaxID=634771 RepID=A0A1T4SXI7_9BACT|nr:hypothetical protein [Chitinophaga eiseniae]SKA32980.1 hypothetical protein SAMN04488128_103748 [Chitinophaga eiseniae]